MSTANPKKWHEIKEIFYAALQQAPEDREQFLNESCQDDEHMRREVESMLSSSDSAGSFMQNPAVGEIAETIAGNKEKLKVGQNFGHYKILKLIGAGGMGEVYLAEDMRLERKVALKIVPTAFSFDAERMHRFVREAKAVSALNHPNILTIYETGEKDDTNYIASEYVEGETLSERLRREPLSLKAVLDIAVQITSALRAAHGAKIVHRDIKPENIMIRHDGYVKVLDFGLAKLIENENSLFGLEDATKKQNQTAKGVIMGTVNYMSPEQAKAEKVDERTDIFSLGVLIYEMIAGRTPFEGNSVSETLANLINKEPQPLSRYAANVSDDLQRIVAKALRKNRDERYQTMKGLLADLKELKENLAFDEKLERSKPPGENETAILQAATGNANKQTAETQHSFSQKIKNHKPLAAFALAAALVAATGFGYWYFVNRTTSPPVKSLAVLPLKSLDAGENYLGLGIADAVIRRINQTGKLIVRPTSAVRRYLNEDTDALTAARQLNADAVLEGSVQRADDRLRVSVNLLRTSDGASLWTDNFDMHTTDIFTIQDTVARQVASRLQLQLDPSQQARLTKRYTSNPIAYEFYVKGVYSFDQRQTEAAIEFFKKAIEADQNFALAYAQLAYAYAVMAIFVEPTEPVWVERANEEINQAQTLDQQLAETHLARSLLLWSRYEGYQNEAAIRELLLAQQLNPNVGHADLGNLYQHIGLEDLAARELQRAFDIDPTSDFVKFQTLGMYLNGGKYDEWFAAHQKFYPNDLIKDQADWIWYYLGKGRLEEAQKAIDELSARTPGDIVFPRSKALLFALKGDFRSAEAMIPTILSKHPLKDLNYHHAAYDIACVYALAGKSGEAIKWLKEAATTGFPCYPLFERDAYLNRIRQAPEFIQFMAEMKAQNERYRRAFA